MLRAAATIADVRELVVIESQAILGAFPAAPAELLISVDADLYPLRHPERADLIDGSIGEGSPLHETFGYYARGVGPETAILPEGSEGRLVRIENDSTRPAVGLCLDAHDLVIAKLVAGREKDLAFTAAAARHGLVDEATLLERVRSTPVSDEQRDRIAQRIAAQFASRVHPHPQS